jgi:lipoate-protein ligase A
MFYLIDNQNNTSPSINLALEEYAAQNLPNDRNYCLFYVNTPCVVVGKNQNVFEEIALAEAEKQNIAILRRISGGGAVYHDEGNLCFSFLSPQDMADVANWRKFAQPILAALQSLGIPAELNYRNDIVVGEFKVSGTAQYTGKNLMISHGTLLLDANLKVLSSVLTANSGHIKSKSLKSFRSKVKNLADFLPAKITMADFRAEMIKFTCGEELALIQFSEAQWAEIFLLAKEKYETWAWNIAWSPAFEMEKTIFYEGIEHHFVLKIVRGGIIESFEISEKSDLNAIFTLLLGCELKKEDISARLENIAADVRENLLKLLFSSKND